MTDAPVQVVVAAFADEGGANEALEELQRAEDNGLISIRDVALIQRDAEGELHIEDSKHNGMGRGAVIGGVAGAIVGVLTGPIGWAAVGGVLIGGLSARLRGSGFRGERLQRLGDTLGPDSSALVAVVEHTWLDEVTKYLGKRAREVVVEAVKADIATQLEAGHDVAYRVPI
jgi:uncharacterized membrane protein